MAGAGGEFKKLPIEIFNMILEKCCRYCGHNTQLKLVCWGWKLLVEDLETMSGVGSIGLFVGELKAVEDSEGLHVLNQLMKYFVTHPKNADRMIHIAKTLHYLDETDIMHVMDKDDYRKLVKKKISDLLEKIDGLVIADDDKTQLREFVRCVDDVTYSDTYGHQLFFGKYDMDIINYGSGDFDINVCWGTHCLYAFTSELQLNQNEYEKMFKQLRVPMFRPEILEKFISLFPVKNN